ncbi:MAG TPA: secretin N-terminal domain-containing protein [Opitutaceae bacterium]
MRTHPLLSALLAASLLTAGRAQTAPAEAETTPVASPAPAAPAVVIQDTTATSGTATREQDTLSVDFPDEDIRNILRNVADLFELNIVVPDTLQGKTSIKLRDVTWRQIFQVVLSPVGYTYAEEGNIIKIVSQESLAQEPVSTEVFILNYARAQDIRPSIEPLVDTAAGGRVITDARSNALVISERPSRMGRIRVIIEELDKATEQVMIESKFVEVTDRDVKNIGVNWASLQNYQLGVGGINQTWDRSRGQQITNGTDRSNGTTNGTNASNTTTTSTNQANGTTTSTTNTNQLSNTTLYGTVFQSTPSTTNFPSGSVNLPSSAPSVTTATGGTTPVATTTTNGLVGTEQINGTTGSTSNSVGSSIIDGITSSTTDALTNLLNIANTGGTNRAASAVFSASDFNLVISALQTQNNVKLVSNPTVVTLNNTEANINIGEEFPIPNYTYNQERGTFEVSGFTYRPIGIILKVTPQVNARGFIKLTVEPEVSSRAGTTTFGGAGGAEIPIIATRKSKTQISLKDGFTMGIGGLIENTSQNGQSKVPVLGNIPGLGRLFRSDTKNVDSRNLLIFITAKTVNAEGAAIEEVFDPRAVRSMGLRRDELPGYRDGSDPFAPVASEAKKKE